MKSFFKKLRTELGLKQIQIAELLKVGPSTWNQYEHGKRIPQIAIALRLVKLSGKKGVSITLEDIYSR